MYPNPCPCGRQPQRETMEFGEGIMDGHGRVPKITRRVYASRYFSDPEHGGTGTEFCSAECMVKWLRLFWGPWKEHTR